MAEKTTHPRAGHPADPRTLVDVPRLVSAYYTEHPDAAAPEQRVAFGTSGHRGSSLRHSFNEDHILAVTQAICRYRAERGINGPLFLGKDTHALSEPAFSTALEVLAAHDVEVRVDARDGHTPTPSVSHAIVHHNRDRETRLADGIVITPSHNPPEDGGFKYNPPSGGPADTDTTSWIEKQANASLADGLRDIRRIALSQARAASTTVPYDYIEEYVADLSAVVDMDAIRSAGVKIGVDPMGGAGLAYWEPIANRYGLDVTVVNERLDPTFGFMRLDRDGRIRMDCSSPYAMAGLIDLKDRFDVAVGNDTDFDRHGIVTRAAGLLPPNHYLSVAISYLFEHRTEWPQNAAIGKTLVSSSMIDRVAKHLGRRLAEVPVGFKWFVDGLLDGSFGFGGEESAGASFLRRDGSVWTTDKDGIIMDLLAAEIVAKTGRDPGELYAELAARFGEPVYERIDAAATPEQKQVLARLAPEQVSASELAGEKIEQILTRAPANDAAIGGLKVVTANGWFAARPSGTEDVYKIYAESFLGRDHLERIQSEAMEVVTAALSRA